MSKSIFGIINSCDRSSRINGLEEYRPIGAFTFGGRYRVIDFIISNMSNSGINQIRKQSFIFNRPYRYRKTVQYQFQERSYSYLLFQTCHLL